MRYLSNKPLCAPGVAMDTRLIGISNYDDPGYAPLPPAVRDAEEIAAAPVGSAGSRL